MSDRRHFLRLGAGVSALALAGPVLAAAPAATDPALAVIAAAPDFAALEAASGGRLGVCLLDTAGGRVQGHRLHERFPMCSTFKALLAAAVLAQADQGRLSLDRRLQVRARDLLEHAPVTRRHVGKDLTVRDLCRATMVTSDNTAANLLLQAIGGPAAVTAFVRALGDDVTRLDRYEPELNLHAPGDPRDTSSPAAMAASLARVVAGEALAPASRQQLADWLVDNQTGDACLRAGLGPRWRVGDKTGSDGRSIRNDVAVLWPLAGGAPQVLAAFLEGARVGAAARDAVLAQAARLAEGLVGGGQPAGP